MFCIWKIFIYLYIDKSRFGNSFGFVELQRFIFYTFIFDCIAEKLRLQLRTTRNVRTQQQLERTNSKNEKPLR